MGLLDTQKKTVCKSFHLLQKNNSLGLAGSSVYSSLMANGNVFSCRPKKILFSIFFLEVFQCT